MKQVVIALSTILMATSSAFGARTERRVDRSNLVTKIRTLRLRRTSYSGQSTIRVREALRKQGVDVKDVAVRSITISAKTEEGRGNVRLLVGRELSDPVRVAVDSRTNVRRRGERDSGRDSRRHNDRRRRPRDLFNERGGMNRVSISSPVSVREQLRSEASRIQLQLNGNFKVSDVVVELVSKARRKPEPRKPEVKKPKTDLGKAIAVGIIGGIIGKAIEQELHKNNP